MHEGYGNRFVSECVRRSVTTLMAAYPVYMSKVRRHTVSCWLLKICIVWTLLKTFRLGDMALFASYDYQRLGSFLTKNMPMVLDMIRNSIVYKALTRSDDYLN